MESQLFTTNLFPCCSRHHQIPRSGLLEWLTGYLAVFPPLFCLGNIAGSILRQIVFGFCRVASSGSISPCQARSLLLSCYKRCRCFASVSAPMDESPTPERTGPASSAERSRILRWNFCHCLYGNASKDISFPPQPWLPPPPWKGARPVPVPATPSAVFTHPQDPLHSGGQFQGLLSSRTAGSCTLRGEAGPCAQDSWWPLRCLRKEHVTQAGGRQARLGRREYHRVGKQSDPAPLLSKLHHVSESPFPFLWDDNKNISILPHKATLKAQTRKLCKKAP